MQLQRLDDATTVSGQLAPGDFAALAASGVRLVINNRPDDEVPGQMSAAEGARLAEQAGLSYLHLPVRMPTLSMDQVDRFAAALSDADGKVHAHCAAGPRSTVLWMLAQVRSGAMDRDALAAWGRERGIDTAPVLGWLDRSGY